MESRLPLIIHEDGDLLAINKPAGINTHAPGPYAGEGIYDWLRHREPRWSRLAIMHRLDKETSGVLVFAKSAEANRSLTRQFSEHAVRKRYLLLTDRPVRQKQFTCVSSLVRAGERYISRPGGPGVSAETRFEVLGTRQGRTELAAEPVTGRTHQIRAQAAERGLPVLGDALYGGSAAGRVCLHAAELALRHPSTGEEMVFKAPADFDADCPGALRAALIHPEETSYYRLIHGAADGQPGLYADRAGDFLLSQSQAPLTGEQLRLIEALLGAHSLRGAYHKILDRRVRETSRQLPSPQPAMGEEARGPFTVLENGLRYELSFEEGYSIGLFADQRDNRRRLAGNCIDGALAAFSGPPQAAEALNTFAYTCGFSVCAARCGARVTSLDLSRKYLDWGKRNFELNGLDPSRHDFIHGDAFDWMGRLARKGRRFDAIFLDPPTFSTSKKRGVFQVAKHYGSLIDLAAKLLKPGGTILASANAASLAPGKFVDGVLGALEAAGLRLEGRQYFPQPPDFPVSRDEPAHLKSIWLRTAGG